MQGNVSIYFFSCLSKLFGKNALTSVDLKDDIVNVTATDKFGHEWVISMKEKKYE